MCSIKTDFCKISLNRFKVLVNDAVVTAPPSKPPRASSPLAVYKAPRRSSQAAATASAAPSQRESSGTPV